MELRQLRYFDAVARELHFGRAAASLHMAQPPLSQQIRRLEEHLGVSLFIRNSHRVELTEAGRVLHIAARGVLGEADYLRSLADALREGTAGHLDVGFSAPTLKLGLPAALSAFRARHPDATVSASELPVAEQVGRMLEGGLDLGFTHVRLRHEELELHPLAEIPLRLVMPAGHPCAGRARVRLDELSHDAFVGYDAPFGEEFEDIAVAACRAAGFAPRLIVRGPEPHALVQMVATGLGVGLIPACDDGVAVPGVAVADLEDPAPSVLLAAFTHRWRSSPLAETFLRTVVTMRPEAVAR